MMVRRLSLSPFPCAMATVGWGGWYKGRSVSEHMRGMRGFRQVLSRNAGGETGLEMPECTPACHPKVPHHKVDGLCGIIAGGVGSN
jgi:hypothetical protein